MAASVPHAGCSGVQTRPHTPTRTALAPPARLQGTRLTCRPQMRGCCRTRRCATTCPWWCPSPSSSAPSLCGAAACCSAARRCGETRAASSRWGAVGGPGGQEGGPGGEQAACRAARALPAAASWLRRKRCSFRRVAGARPLSRPSPCALPLHMSRPGARAGTATAWPAVWNTGRCPRALSDAPCPALQAWAEGGYSDDLTVASRCTELGLAIHCPGYAIFPQWCAALRAQLRTLYARSVCVAGEASGHACLRRGVHALHALIAVAHGRWAAPLPPPAPSSRGGALPRLPHRCWGLLPGPRRTAVWSAGGICGAPSPPRPRLWPVADRVPSCCAALGAARARRRLEGRYSWRRWWNYLRRQLYVMDTYRRGPALLHRGRRL